MLSGYNWLDYKVSVTFIKLQSQSTSVLLLNVFLRIVCIAHAVTRLQNKTAWNLQQEICQYTPSLCVSWYKRLKTRDISSNWTHLCVVCFGPISSLVTNHLVRVKKTSWFGSKYLFWCHDHGNSLFWSTQKQLEISPGVIKNIRWCDTNTQPRWLVMKPPPSPDSCEWYLSWRKVSTDRPS